MNCELLTRWLPTLGDLAINSVDVSFRFLSAHFEHSSSFSSMIVAADSEFQPNLDASLGAFLDKGLMDLRILILVIDLRAAG